VALRIIGQHAWIKTYQSIITTFTSPVTMTLLANVKSSRKSVDWSLSTISGGSSKTSCEEYEIRIVRKEEGQVALEGLANQDFARHSLNSARNPIGQILGSRLCKNAAQRNAELCHKSQHLVLRMVTVTSSITLASRLRPTNFLYSIRQTR
jgi:hypothetical protein